MKSPQFWGQNVQFGLQKAAVLFTKGHFGGQIVHFGRQKGHLRDKNPTDLGTKWQFWGTTSHSLRTKMPFWRTKSPLTRGQKGHCGGQKAILGVKMTCHETKNTFIVDKNSIWETKSKF